MQSWYLLYCKRGQLQRAQEHLERQAVNCLAPMITLEKIVRGKRTAVSEPLFPNYLFVEFDPEVIHTTTINATRGVSHFVRFGASPAIVPSAVIHQLSVYKPKDIVDPATPYPGDKVIITEGAFEGCASLESADLSSAAFATVGGSAFRGCTALSSTSRRSGET